MTTHHGDRPDLRALPLDRLVPLVVALGEKPFRARQLFRWLHQKGAASLDEMTDVPRSLRAALAERTSLTTLGRTPPASMLKVVVFPAPFGPSRPTTSAGWTARSTPRTTVVSP